MFKHYDHHDNENEVPFTCTLLTAPHCTYTDAHKLAYTRTHRPIQMDRKKVLQDILTKTFKMSPSPSHTILCTVQVDTYTDTCERNE